MKNLFRYFLLLGVYIIPIHFLLDHEEKFPIMLFGFLGITIAYWGILLFQKWKKKE